MNVRMVQEKDIDRMLELLKQVNLVHYNGRPDLFKVNTKYSKEQLKDIIKDTNTPILVATDDKDVLMGYAFCIFKQYKDDSILTDVKTLYIDDLCIDETCRGQHIGSTLYDAVIEFAKKHDCYNVTLNVWSCNPNAIKFYEHCGLKPQKITMEKIL